MAERQAKRTTAGVTFADDNSSLYDTHVSAEVWLIRGAMAGAEKGCGNVGFGTSFGVCDKQKGVLLNS